MNTDLTHLKALFNWGVKNKYVKHNPFEKIAKFKVKNRKPRILSVDEWDRLWNIARYSRWRILILTYLFTGARISEILKPKLKWKDINFEKSTITLANRKRGKSITLPMPRIVSDALLQLKKDPMIKETSIRDDDCEYPFPFHKDYISHSVKDDVFMPGGLDDITIHDLRRTFGSYLIHIGIPVAIVSQLMSHSSTLITEQMYIGQLDSVQREAMNGLANFLLPDGSKSPKEIQPPKPAYAENDDIKP